MLSFAIPFQDILEFSWWFENPFMKRDSVESKRIYDPFFILGQRGYERFQTEIFLDICRWSPVQALRAQCITACARECDCCAMQFCGSVLLDLRFPSCAEIFLNGLPSRLATQCSSVSATEKILPTHHSLLWPGCHEQLCALPCFDLLDSLFSLGPAGLVGFTSNP